MHCPHCKAELERLNLTLIEEQELVLYADGDSERGGDSTYTLTCIECPKCGREIKESDLDFEQQDLLWSIVERQIQERCGTTHFKVWEKSLR